MLPPVRQMHRLQASQTGHIVLATLHTDDCAETYSRALGLTLDKERDAFRLAQNLKLVVPQRLLTKYEGPVVKRRLTRDEQQWLDVNGIPYGDEIAEVVPQRVVGKVAVLEAVVTTPEIKQVIRADRMDTSAIYRAACDQDHFEPLAAGGVRAVQAHSSTLHECMQRLEGNTDARLHPSLRVRLAREHGLDFVQVADAIDAFHVDADSGSKTTIEPHIATAQLGTLNKVIEQEAV